MTLVIRRAGVENGGGFCGETLPLQAALERHNAHIVEH
jgi:hypothetical protein